MDPYIAIITGLGFVVLLTAWLPMVLKELPLSLPMFCIGFGAALFAIPGIPGTGPKPQEMLGATERLTELVVIISLTGAGLKLDRQLSWARAKATWLLLGVSMPLTIGLIAGLGHFVLNLSWPTAILLGAVLAPTDPVLASDVQVGGPGKGQEDEVRFTLTSEAGLNDALAFPFVNLAIVLAMTSAAASETFWFSQWALIDVAWKLSAGLVAGVLVGRGLGFLTFRLPNRSRISRTGDGFVSLGLTLISYGVTEMIHGYGFLAAFVAAVAFRAVESNHKYHEKLHDFSEQFERLLMMILLVVFGGALFAGELLTAVNWPVAAVAMITLFVVRPLTGWIGLSGIAMPIREKAVISFFGIRGLGSVYYLSYALGHANFDAPATLWSTVSLIILISVMIHGATVTPVLRRLDQIRKR
jgi:NhaP-type Na+/H+ or K+/H+ antiporter